MHKKIGCRLRAIRLDRNFSQEYLAHEFNMTQGNYSKLESGNHFPTPKTMEKLAKVYGMTANDLLSFEDHVGIKTETQISMKGKVDLKVGLNSQEFLAKLLDSKQKIIELQEKQIEILEGLIKISAIIPNENTD